MDKPEITEATVWFEGLNVKIVQCDGLIHVEGIDGELVSPAFTAGAWVELAKFIDDVIKPENENAS